MKPGLYYNMSFEDYVKIDAVNNSTLKILSSQSPAHCKQYMTEGRPETKALSFGKAADCYILEPTLFAKQYVVGPDLNHNSKAWKEYKASVAEGVEILKQAEMDDIISIYNKISNSHGMRLLMGGKSQVVCIWEDKKTGLTCKSRWDYYNEDIPMITDLKTTISAEPEHFAKDIFKYGYYQQAAFYTDGYKAVMGDKYDCCFAFFTVEKVAPFVNSAFELGDKSLAAGRLAYRKALDLYKKCLDADCWPMYREQITLIEMPNWALSMAGVGEGNTF